MALNMLAHEGTLLIASWFGTKPVVLPLGGDHISNDIAIGLRTPIDKAETIKIQHGAALAALVGGDELRQPRAHPDVLEQPVEPPESGDVVLGAILVEERASRHSIRG